MTGTLLIVTAILMLAYGFGKAEAAVQFNVIDLGTLGDTNGTQANAINNLGQIVGISVPLTETVQAAFWTNSQSPPVDLGSLGGDPANPSVANGINNSGQIVGQSSSHAIFWTNSLIPPVDLGTLGGPTSDAYSINDSGQMVGYADDPNTNSLAAFWTNSAVPPISLGTLGGITSTAAAINRLGQIVGSSSTMNGNIHATFWNSNSSAPFDLGTLGGTNSTAGWINDAGQIVGSALTAGGLSHATYWTNNTSTGLDLGSPGAFGSAAAAINNLGQIIGITAFASNGAPNAIFWATPGSPAENLNTLIPTNSGWQLIFPYAINDLGEICGAGTLNGQGHGFVLVPVNLPINLTIKVSNANVILNFPTGNSALYNIQSRTNLAAGAWNTIVTNIVGTGEPTNIIVGSTTNAARFYRLGSVF